jgi:glycerol kinase
LLTSAAFGQETSNSQDQQDEVKLGTTIIGNQEQPKVLYIVPWKAVNAAEVEDAGGIYIVPAFSGLFAPYWQSDARGIIVGLTRYINKNHICRAALEATAYQTREVLDAMEKDSGVELKSLKVDGGMVYNELLMQFQSDILGVPVIRPVVSETTALGSAYAAGIAVKFWNDLEDLRQNWKVSKTWDPDMETARRAKLYKGWKKAVQRTMNWVEDEE